MFESSVLLLELNDSTKPSLMYDNWLPNPPPPRNRSENVPSTFTMCSCDHRRPKLTIRGVYIAFFFYFLPGPSRRLAPVIKCSPFLSFFQRYIVRDISLAHWKFYPPFWKARGIEDSQQKDYRFLGNDTFPSLYDAQVYERKFKSEYLERQFYERLLKSEPSIEKLIENKSDLSKLSTLSEPSIVKFIENQSEHLSKLTLYHLKRRATRWSRRAREPSRIPLLFLRGLNKKDSMLKKFVEVFKAPSLCYKVRKLNDAR